MLRKGPGLDSVNSQDRTPFLGNSMVHSSHPHISRKAAIVCVLALAIALGFLARGVQAQRSGVGGHFDVAAQSGAATRAKAAELTKGAADDDAKIRVEDLAVVDS